jgi:hypothetical protein
MSSPKSVYVVISVLLTFIIAFLDPAQKPAATSSPSREKPSSAAADEEELPSDVEQEDPSSAKEKQQQAMEAEAAEMASLNMSEISQGRNSPISYL